MVAGLTGELDLKLIENWKRAAIDLGIRVTAPVTLTSAEGIEFQCEVLIHDFGSPTGAIITSPKTRRRQHAEGRDLLEGHWVAVEKGARYHSNYAIEALADLCWFGAGAAPAWLPQR